MTVRRPIFFLCAFLLLTSPFLIYKIKWLSGSAKATGMVGFTGQSYTGQIGHTYAVVLFKVGRDTVWFNGFDNLLFPKGAIVPVRYQKNDPWEARIDVFASIWGDTLVYGGIPTLILLVLFLHPAIIPYRSRLRLSRKKPFIFIA